MGIGMVEGCEKGLEDGEFDCINMYGNKADGRTTW